MRDIAVVLIILGLIPVILKYPWTGVLVSAWVSIFNPHRFTWGFAYELPIALVAGAVTAVSMVLNWKEVRLHNNSVTALLILLPLWMTVTTVFALEPKAAFGRWADVMKTFLFILIAASLLHSRKQLEGLLWVIVVSIGFFGIKGGIFTFLGGGVDRVYGPPGSSFLSDNNAISVAMIMVIPLMYYLSTTVSARWLKWGMYGAMILSSLAVLGSHSRGAFVAFMAMVVFLWLKGKNKLAWAAALVAVLILSLGVMPGQWVARMESIQNYEQDASAQGRINTWHMAFNLANDRPLVGGGFEPYTARTFAIYAPNPTDIHSAHSIYFQVLGEHGYIGLLLFLSLGMAGWMRAQRIIKASRDRPDFAWAANLARATQVSLVAFAVGGLFVNIAYWEMQYYEIVILMGVYRLLSEVEAKPKPGARKTEQEPELAVSRRL